MSKYEIKRWDIIMSGNSTFKSPIVYIKPDLDFLEFARANNFALMAVIEGTGLQYDGNQIPAIVNKGCSLPNCRPNLSEATGEYVITLDSNSYGYPKNGQLGTVSFLGLNKVPTDVNENEVVSNPSQNMRSVNENKNMKVFPVVEKKKLNYIIILGLLMLLVLLYFLAKKLCEEE